MKNLITLLIVAFIGVTTNAQEFKFEKELINYGKISKGSEGERTFVFTNIGDEPLIIKNIQSTCGCTIPKKPKDPIMPGQKGEIKVSYDTKRLGGFSKSITIFSNAKNKRKVIRIRGIVENKGVLEKERSILSDM